VIAAGQSSLTAINGSTEQSQFTEKTPLFTEAEIHHLGSEDLQRITSTTNLVKEP
jgi:hypothetical protein